LDAIGSHAFTLSFAGLAQLRLPEFEQAAAAASLYALSVICFTVPPLEQVPPCGDAARNDWTGTPFQRDHLPDAF